MIIEGLPLFFIEFTIGQRFRSSAVTAWARVSPALRGIGWSCIVVSCFLCVYYIVVLAWCIYYFFMSFTSNLPWLSDQACMYHDQYQNILRNIAKYKDNATLRSSWETAKKEFPDCCVRDPSQWYFYQRALRISNNIEDNGIGLNVNLVGCLVIGWIVTYMCVIKGIKSSGKVYFITNLYGQ